MIVRQDSHHIRWLVLLGIGVSLLVALFVIKTNVLAAQKRERTLTKVLEREVQDIKMLKAEIAYLERPERINRLSQQYLNLSATDSKKLIRLDDLGKVIPPQPKLVQGARERGEREQGTRDQGATDKRAQ